MMHIVSKTVDDTAYIKIAGPVYSQNVSEFRRQLQALCTQNFKHIVFDFSKVPFFSSKAAEMFSAFCKDSAKRGRHISVEGTSEYVFDLFQMNHLEQVFAPKSELGAEVIVN